MIRYVVDVYQADGQRILSHDVMALDDQDAIRQAQRHMTMDDATNTIVRRITNGVRYDVVFDSRKGASTEAPDIGNW